MLVGSHIIRKVQRGAGMRVNPPPQNNNKIIKLFFSLTHSEHCWRGQFASWTAREPLHTSKHTHTGSINRWCHTRTRTRLYARERDVLTHDHVSWVAGPKITLPDRHHVHTIHSHVPKGSKGKTFFL